MVLATLNFFVPPVFIPLAVAGGIWYIVKVWWPGQVRIMGREDALLAFVIVPIVSLSIIAGAVHFFGVNGDAQLANVWHGVMWIVNGLLWDLLHPFAYGFSVSNN